MNWLYLFSSILILQSSKATDVQQNLCGPLPVQLIFANGMFNSFHDASDSWDELNWQFRSHLKSQDETLLQYLTRDDDEEFYERVVDHSHPF